MKTCIEIEADFRRDLAALLAKYNADLDITEDGDHFVKGIAIVTIRSTYDAEYNQLSEYTEFWI